MGVALRILDEDGYEVGLDSAETETLIDLTGCFESATVSACPRCLSRVLATVALVDLLAERAPHSRGADLVDLADDAPTLHLFVVDTVTGCSHASWRDPLFAEWAEVVGYPGTQALH
ncbi:MAG: hypothetical protein M5T61_13475 [Acidimicrobiia bacterium]|nr:hypothetical protein [Acidimicrobiia bacterium]